MTQVQDLIRTAADTGDLKPLAEFLKDRPMSPTGFVKTEAGSFGDGYSNDTSWYAVDSAVMEGELSQAQYNELRTLVGR